MSDKKNIRINKILKELNIPLDRAVEFLTSKDLLDDQLSLNSKISEVQCSALEKQFSADKGKKVAAIEVTKEHKKETEEIRKQRERELQEKKRQKELEEQKAKEEARLKEEERLKQEALEKEQKAKEEAVVKAQAEKVAQIKTVGKIDLEENKKSALKKKQNTPQERKSASILNNITSDNKKDNQNNQASPDAKQEVKVENKKEVAQDTTSKDVEQEKSQEPEKIETQYKKLSGTTFTGKTIDLSKFEKPKKKKEDKDSNSRSGRNKRKRISKPKPAEGNISSPSPNPSLNRNNNSAGNKGKSRGRKPVAQKVEPTEEEVKNQIKETLERLQGNKQLKSKAAKYRKDKREQHRKKEEETRASEESKVLKVTEFVTVGEISSMMDVPINKVIGACMTLGIMVTMNQRLDAETLTIVAEEFGYEVDFTTTELEETIEEVVDDPKDLEPRAPIVTVMGHVDHGKTSLLDYVRKANVIAGESGGITQHIGAYAVRLEGGQKITFLDTPGHEAFTAMRARGARVTDIAIIVVAADDDIMPQTKEAISHAQAAGVPIVFAINKVDKPTANPDRIKERLASMNLLVEEWGGKYQSQDISAKFGQGVGELLEKVLLEAEMLDLKANPKRLASGTVVEAFLDKGRGYVSTILVQNGTLRVGDYILAGKNHGKVRAMHDERGNSVQEAGPAQPISILGLDGAPTAGDKFSVFEDEKEAKNIAAKRTQLLREQSVRAQKHITLAEIGRRIALGDFKELNIILKGDVDGSVEALSDSFSKLSTEEIQINIIHKGVGAITESDVLLASASDAVIIGFNVRPMVNAKTLAEQEEIDIKTYSIIYDAIDDIKDAMEGLLSPELKEEITGSAEIRQVFKISKVGSVAGCMVLDGKIFRGSNVRLIRDNVVVYDGVLAALKRFTDDAKEVPKGYECGMQIKNYNDIKEGDIIEAYREVEVKKKL